MALSSTSALSVNRNVVLVLRDEAATRTPCAKPVIRLPRIRAPWRGPADRSCATGWFSPSDRDGPRVIATTIPVRPWIVAFEARSPWRRMSKRVSKPGRRVYAGVSEMPQVRQGLGVAILSTPKGVMSDTAARDANVGGEVLLRVY